MTVVVVGSGRLARAVCYSLGAMAHRLPAGARVVVVGRRPEPVAELCYIASTRAALAGAGGPTTDDAGPAVRFEPVVVDVSDGAAIADVLGGIAPEGVLLCASTQSPWERLTAPSAWTALVERARFGITLPFQAEQAMRVAEAVPDGAWFVNACFPDAVNPLLAALDVPVLTGVGNIGLLAASVQAARGLPDQSRLRMLAHHVHLYQPADRDEEAVAWLDGEPLPDVGALLAAQRASARDELNHVTGHTAAVLVAALLTGSDLDTNLPGPLGLPGGYPVRLRSGARHIEYLARDGSAHQGRVELRLPDGVSVDAAVARNQRWAFADGAVVEDGKVRFGDAAAAELAALAPELAAGFAATDLLAVAARMHRLRDQLRARPSGR